MSEYRYSSLIICSNKDAGNALANLAAAFPNDPDAEMGTFDDGRTMALASDPGTPVAWYAIIPSKSTMAGVISALKAGADYEDDRLGYLRERGLSVEQWAMASAIFPVVDVYDIFDAGYKPEAMAQLAEANGYVIVEAQEP